jgi:taurine transport system substrate-binding protein
MRRIHAVLVILASLFGSFVAAHAQQTLPLRLGYQTGDINVQLMYAINTGLFDKMKIDAKFVPFPAGPAMLPALAASEIGGCSRLAHCRRICKHRQPWQ